MLESDTLKILQQALQKLDAGFALAASIRGRFN